jgi:dTMP kinase
MNGSQFQPNRGRPLLICFTGIDGGGKSTQARALAERLSERGVRVRYVYARNVPLLYRPVLLLSGLVFLRNKRSSPDYRDRTTTKSRALANHPILARINYGLLLADAWLQLLVKVRYPLIRGTTVVCDRYIDDTIVTDIAADLGLEPTEIASKIARWRRRIAEPDCAFLIDLPEEVAMSRKDDVPAIEYLIERRRLYRGIVAQLGLIVIDGTLSPDAIGADVDAAVEPLMEGV